MSAESAGIVGSRGLKRLCIECGIRFYDMNKRPIVCPTCDAEFTGFEKPKGRAKVAAVAEEKKPKIANDEAQAAEETVEVESQADEVNLDEAAAEEKSGDDLDEGQIDMDGDMEELDDINVDELDDEALDDLDSVDEDLDD